MKIKGISFNRWIQNHPVGHNAIWFRECMPWVIFKEIDFSTEFLNKEQIIIINNEAYTIIVLSIILQENGRLLAKIKISFTNSFIPISEYPWDTMFSIIYDPKTYQFITAFPSKEHPLKNSVKQFMNGKLDRLSPSDKSRLLYARTLMSFVTSQLYPELNYLRYYKIEEMGKSLKSPKKGLPMPSRPAIPMFSEERKFWIHFCWDEAIAHRFGLFYSTQCERMLIIFVHPVYTKHHRCNSKGVEILSLSEYVDRLEHPLRVIFDRQLWFIREGSLPDTVQETLWTPNNYEFKETIPIRIEELKEALSIRELALKDENDVAYLFSAYNLINAWVARIKDDTEFRKREGLFKELYSFKNRLSAAIARLILSKISNINVFIDASTKLNTTYVNVKGVQFSFHYITMRNIMIKYEKSRPNALPIKGDYLEDYSRSSENKFQEWTGFQLQPIASLILAWARRERRIAALNNLSKEFYH